MILQRLGIMYTHFSQDCSLISVDTMSCMFLILATAAFVCAVCCMENKAKSEDTTLVEWKGTARSVHLFSFSTLVLVQMGWHVKQTLLTPQLRQFLLLCTAVPVLLCCFLFGAGESSPTGCLPCSHQDNKKPNLKQLGRPPYTKRLRWWNKIGL